MPDMTPDQEWAAMTGPAQKREMDSLSEQMASILDGVGKANQGIEGAKKNLSGIWGLIAIGIAGVWYASSFVSTYNSVMANGSPAMLQMKGELQTSIAGIKKTDDDRYDTLNSILIQLKASNDLVDKRLTRLEDAEDGSRAQK